MNSVRVEQGRMPGPHGAIATRTYRPAAGTPAAALVWLHGGSFMSGDLDMPEADFVAQQLAGQGVEVVTVGYQLSPTPPEFIEAAGGWHEGVHYPVAVDEIEHVVKTLSARCARPLSLGGASAGGALAASTAVRLRNAGVRSLVSVVLAYPLLHRALPEPHRELASILKRQTAAPTAQEVQVMNENYLGPHVSPQEARLAFAGDGQLDGLPPMLIVDSEVDVLRASSQHFAAAVIAAGGEIHYVVEPGTHHGHLNTPGAAATRSTDRIADWLLHRPAADQYLLPKDQITV